MPSATEQTGTALGKLEDLQAGISIEKLVETFGTKLERIASKALDDFERAPVTTAVKAAFVVYALTWVKNRIKGIR